MSDAHASTAATGSVGLFDRNHFLLRRLHSLTGVLPIGVFVCFHLFTNMQMIFGTFQHEVDFIHNMPALLFMEIFGIWLPIAFHAGLGILYTFSGKPNTASYPYMDNWRYTLQRVTGIVAFIFIFVHIAKLRWGWDFGGILDTPFYTRHHFPDGSVLELAHASTAYAMQHAWPLVLIYYVVGVASVVYHWANGLWTFAITWGLTVSVAAQKRWGFICAGMGMALALFSAAAIYSAATYQLSDEERTTIEALKTGAMEYHAHPIKAHAGTVAPPETAAGQPSGEVVHD